MDGWMAFYDCIWMGSVLRRQAKDDEMGLVLSCCSCIYGMDGGK
jgi:hypothetical protein